MTEDYVNEAQKLEKFASAKRRAARHTKKRALRESFLRDAIEGYEEAGKYWMREAKQNQEYPRKARYALLNARNDLDLLESIRAELPKKDLSKKLLSVTAIVTLVSALFFVSSNFTGNVILGLTENNSRWIGLCLFACGLICAFFYFKKK